MNSEAKTKRLSSPKSKSFMCLACGTAMTLRIEAYEARLGYCPNCKQTYLYKYVPTEYSCIKCNSPLELVECSVVHAKCSRCGVYADFTCEIDDWDTFYNLVYDVATRRVQPGGNFLLSIGEPLVVESPESAVVKNYKLPTTTELTGVAVSEGKSATTQPVKKLPETAISKLREVMKKKWQDPEYRRRVIDGLKKKWELKKNVAASGSS